VIFILVLPPLGESRLHAASEFSTVQ